MRVIAGKYRTRNLKAGARFRPTTDRVRETLFNMLQSEIPGASFADVFGGSGSVGIEALSRGARIAYFVEPSRAALSVLESNLAFCEGDSWRIFSMTANRALDVLRAHEPVLDLMFFDPPYDFEDYPGLLRQAALLFPEALLILESSSRQRFKIPEELEQTKEREIGETRLAFFRASQRRPM